MGKVQVRYGFLYEPGSEAEVCMLFGLLMPYIGDELKRLFNHSEYYVDEWVEKPTDLILRVGDEEKRVEFELCSSNFREHGHNPEECDLIVCWKNDWYNSPVQILELSKIVEEKFPGLIINKRSKHPERVKAWSFEEFMNAMRKNLSNEEYQEFSEFIEELKAVEGIEFKFGKGDKISTLNIYFRKLSVAPLTIESTGKALIAYFNVNKKPPEPNFPENKIVEIRSLLDEPEKLWHYIQSSNSQELISKLRKIVEIIISD